jgi:DNA polymerase III epsilon subunit-like protein
MNNKQTILCSIDIETSGPNMIKNGILSIGICAGTINGTIIIKKRFDLKLDDNITFDKNTFDNFWKKNLRVLNEIQQNPIDSKNGITQFINLIDKLDKEYVVIIISDCVTFDIGFINYYLAKYLDRNPLTYKFSTEFRPVYDTDSYARGFLKKDYKNIYTLDTDIMKKLNIQISINKKLQHLPEVDAEYNYNLHRMILIKK